MDKQNNWKEFSEDISEITKKIKSNIVEDENIDDLKESFKLIKNTIFESFSDLTNIVENTVKDEEIKKDVVSVVNKLKNEVTEAVSEAKDKISSAVDTNKDSSSNSEEE
tara:strand:- start:86 stop:412 length:327 start_codon:yes stop_codon:yes gene_type:complete